MMGGGEESREEFNRAVNFGISRDLPKNFTNRSGLPDRKRAVEDEEVELSLGLSLNGRFGLDPAAKRLKRSSSVSNFISGVDFSDCSGMSSNNYQARGGYAPLERTCSLPAVALTETDTQDHRRRKELNSLKYMEARKKRMEKLKNGRVVKEKESYAYADVYTGNDDVTEIERKQASQGSSSSSGSVTAGSGSSGISDLRGQQMMDGTKTITSATTSSSSLQLPQDEAVHKPSSSDGKGGDKSLKNPLLDMPYVTTRVDGPNTPKIEGFLYRYRKGEDVKIVCVCHGLFLSPAEFVKHGGGGDVEQPLKHIVVNPFPLF